MSPTRTGRRGLAALATVGLSLGLAGVGVAGAHVSPENGEVPAGSYTNVQLQVPHGCDGKATKIVEVQVPKELTSASPYVIPGWKATVTTEKLATPISDGHGGQLTDRDAQITWTAEPGNELPDHQVLRFGISFKAPDKVGTTLFFKTIQSCDGGEASWVTEWDGTGDEPDSPAPAVKVVAAAEGSGHGHGDQGDQAADPPAKGGTGHDADDDDDGDGASNGLAIAGLVAGLAGLGLGGAAFASTRKASKGN